MNFYPSKSGRSVVSLYIYIQMLTVQTGQLYIYGASPNVSYFSSLFLLPAANVRNPRLGYILIYRATIKFVPIQGYHQCNASQRYHRPLGPATTHKVGFWSVISTFCLWHESTRTGDAILPGTWL
jgi:hypothetical protein